MPEHPLGTLSSPQEALDRAQESLASPDQIERLAELRSFFESDGWKGIAKRCQEERARIVEACLKSMSQNGRTPTYLAGVAEGLLRACVAIPLELIEEAAKAKALEADEQEPEDDGRY